MAATPLVRVVLLIPIAVFPFCAAGQDPQPSRLHGYVGGPYKVLATDLTGDGHVDVMLGFRQLGLVAVERGDGRGNLAEPVLNEFGRHRGVSRDDKSWSEPHIHNLACADLDGDGLPDVMVGVAGLSTIQRGSIVLARNLGKGRFEKQLEYEVPSQAKGVAFADLDRDGRLDVLYTARGSGYKDDLKRGVLYLRRGLGGWKFGPAIESDAGKSAYHIETADLNNDGFLDIIVPNEHDSCATYFLNPGKSVFEAKALPSRIARATQIPGKPAHAVNDVRATDFDEDGNQDLLTANLGSSTVSIFRGNGDGTFQKDTILDAGKNGAFLAVADLDSDGDSDFVITHWTEDFASVFLNRGDGTFAPKSDIKTGLGNYGVDIADLNGDGHLDIVTANYRARSRSLLLGVGDGSFRPAKTAARSLRLYEGKWISAD